MRTDTAGYSGIQRDTYRGSAPKWLDIARYREYPRIRCEIQAGYRFRRGSQKYTTRQGPGEGWLFIVTSVCTVLCAAGLTSAWLTSAHRARFGVFSAYRQTLCVSVSV